MIADYSRVMNDDEKGKRFLKLIDEQSTIQWSIVAKLSSLISSDWKSEPLQDELKALVDEHTTITREINSIDDN